MTRASLEQAERTAREIARELRASMPDGWGFILWLSSFGNDGFTTYLSSIEREAAIRFLKEWLAYIEPTPATSEFVDGTALSCWCCGATTQNLIRFRGPHRSVELCAACVSVPTDPRI